MACTVDYGVEEMNKKAVMVIEDMTTNAEEVQLRVLAEILSANAGVEYLQRHGLAGATDRETFKKMVPVVTYDDIKSDIYRIVHGDTSPIFSSHPVSEFFISSGTSSGESKFIPTSKEACERMYSWGILMMPLISQHIPGLHKGKGMYLRSTKPATTTPSGLLAQPALTSYFKSPDFLKRPHHPYFDLTSPNETILCHDSFQSIYSQLLCALCQRLEVNRIGAAFVTGLIWDIKFLHQHWPLLCTDIRTGTLNPQITDSSVREAVLKILKSDPELASFVETECRKESWKGIVRSLWPNAKFAEAIATGTMSQYVPTLDYYLDGLPIVCSVYGASEGYFGFNLDPLSRPTDVSYTIIPSMAYFEFLPLNIDEDGDSKCRDLIDLVNVELGQEYEIVITTYAGLYRYRLGDVLRVTGFKNKTPQFKFVCRENVILSVDYEKTTEDVLQSAVQNGSKLLEPFGAALVDYTSCIDTCTDHGHYVLFWEVTKSTTISSSVFEECCLTIEDSLHREYRHCRVSGSIGPLEIKLVKEGTFDELMECAISSGASMSQYKTPRYVKSTCLLELLNSRIVRNYFSPNCPKWDPSRIDEIDNKNEIKN